MAYEVDNLEIKVSAESASAAKNITDLAEALGKLKTGLQGSTGGMKTLAARLTDIKNAATGSAGPIKGITRLTEALGRLKGLTISKSIPERLSAIGTAANDITDASVRRIDDLTRSLSRLRNVNLTGFSAAMRQARAATQEAAQPVSEEPVPVESRTVRAVHIDTAETDKATKKTYTLLDALRSLKKKIKIDIDSSSIGRLLSSVKRVAFYRIIRTALKEIGQAISVGVKDLYQYSQAVGTTFAGAMDRAASASLFFKNSIGSVAGPLIESLVPVLEVVVDRVAALLDKLAQLFAALSGQSTYSKAIKTTTKFAEATTGAAKAMQKYLAPFDELNVITQNSGGGSGKTTPNFSEMFTEAPVSANIAKIADRIREKIKPVFDFVSENLDKLAIAAAAVGGAMLAWKITNGLFADLASVSAVLGKIGSVVKGLALITLGAVLSYDAGYDLGQGKDDLLTWVEGIGGVIAAGIGGALIGAQVGGVPGAITGFAIGVTIGVGFALAGYVQGTLDKVVNDAFFNGQGAITITELAESFKTLAGEIVKTNQPIIDAGEAIMDIRDNKVQPAIDKINEISLSISHGVTTAEEQIPNLVVAFEELESGTKDILDAVYENVVRAVSGSLYDALNDAGVYVPELLDVLMQVKGEVDTTFESLQKGYQSLANEYAEGKISASEYQTSLTDLANKMSDLIGYTDPVAQAFANVSGELKGINWENEEAKNNAFSIIKTAADEASVAVDEAYRIINDNIQTMRGWSKDPAFQNALDSIFLSNETTRNRQREKIGENLQDLFDGIQTDILEKTQGVIDKANEQYESMNFVERLFTGDNQSTFVYKAIGNYKKNIVDPLGDEMQTVLEQFGVDGGTWASDAMLAIVNEMFDPQIFTSGFAGQTTVAWAAGMERTVKDVFEPIAGQFEGYGKDLTSGLGNGLTDNIEDVTDSVTDVTDAMKNTVETELDINSPSKVAEGYGKYFDEGLANGLTDNAETVKTALSSLLQEMSQIYQNFFNGIIKGHNDMLKNLDDSLKDTKVNGNSFSVSRAKTVVVKPNAYATGGFPEDGLFFANHGELVGKFRNGRTAVANNDAIEGGIAVAVENGNVGVINALMTVGNMIVRAVEESDNNSSGGSADMNRIARRLYPALKRLDGVHGTAMVTG